MSKLVLCMYMYKSIMLVRNVGVHENEKGGYNWEVKLSWRHNQFPEPVSRTE